MPLDRIDLADIHDPERLARALHRQLCHAAGAVPVVEIAQGLDILEVRQENLDGCEGTLLTDAVRSYGKILVNARRGPLRARSSIAHELGHFLLERHRLHGGAGFVCRARDMSERGHDLLDRRQEAEANTFAIGLLAPARLLAEALRQDPDLAVVKKLARDLELRVEAMTRRYVNLHDEPLAAVWSKGGIIRSAARNWQFPYLDARPGRRLDPGSRAAAFLRSGSTRHSRMQETDASGWLRDPTSDLFEQAQVGRKGYALTLLWGTLSEEDDEGADLAASYTPSFAGSCR